MFIGLYICPRPCNAKQKEWSLILTMDAGNNVSVDSPIVTKPRYRMGNGENLAYVERSSTWENSLPSYLSLSFAIKLKLY